MVEHHHTSGRCSGPQPSNEGGLGIDFISLGCSKNLVDSEMLMGLFEAHGFRVTHDSPNPDGEICVVNTCGFIADAKEESINTILEQVQRKAEGKLQKLYVMGCLSERYLAELEAEIPEVDGWYGKFNYKELLKDLEAPSAPPTPPEGGTMIPTSSKTIVAPSGAEGGAFARVLTTPRHFAYLKISEGCDRTCAYCAIPLITGRHQSRPMEEILDEVRWLVSQGVKELNVIAQELTYYGLDLYGEQRIAQLVEQMAQVEGVEWIRLHYAYPTHFPWELTRVMREYNNVCNYLDVALQHISNNMLQRMRRHITRQETLDFIERLRREVPGICLRTTLMVGFPGETEEDFKELLDFTRMARFERMGAFAYSEEEGTYAAQHFVDDVAPEVKERRLARLMRLQQNISEEMQQQLVGQVMKVVIDRREGDYYVGRNEFSSPEVDPEVLIAAKGVRLTIGRFYQVRIIGAEEFDLYGEIVRGKTDKTT
ncbi:MAG: 30S ribosomal protein S12 methylthiotransferase RimO [Prevotella sp.]|nr:30S ribosomal protein S12 methylthiotransferase RimO [Prevotella sp.]